MSDCLLGESAIINNQGHISITFLLLAMLDLFLYFTVTVASMDT